jgi:phage terminase small subunit
MPKLTEKEELFVHDYVVNGRNARKAAETAGYSYPDKAGYNVLHKPHITEAIEIVYGERNRRLGVSKDWVLAELLDQLKVLKAEEKPKLNSKTGKAIKDKDGNAIYIRNETQITKVLELIGKVSGIDAFDEKHTITMASDQSIIDAMQIGSERLKNAPDFGAEEGPDDLGVRSDKGDYVH